MNIHVGIVGGNFHGWLSLLQQEGIPHSTSVHDLSPDRFSVIVAGDTAEERTIKSIKKYLAGGGAVLCSGKVFEQLSNSVCIQSPIRYLLGASDYHFAGIGLIDCYRQCHVHPYANVVNSDSGKPCIFMGEYGGGTIVVLPFDAGGLMLDTRTSTKSFYAEHHRLPFEHVSLVSKGGLLKLVARSLELLHHERGLPYAHAWHFPSHEKTIFCFRIDTDYASRKELGDLY
ncbi:MAG: hypothetical protein HY277_09230, partial [Ignavibacteriales bacterium]|nr:hypothetical protein [Ignavibacteriales bacterium]